jgi:hypothetical protein
VDAAGSAYVTGYTASNPFPTTAGAFQTAYQGGAIDAFVTRLNASGNALVYSTYLGGTGNDVGENIAVDAAGSAYVAGATGSNDFPTQSPFQPAFAGGAFDAFVTRLNASGNALVYSTYLGGTGDDHGYGLAVDAAGSAYVTGVTKSNNFPTTPGAFQTAFGGGFYDIFVTRLNASGNALVYSTYLGGTGNDVVEGIALDAAGNAYVAGYTDSNPFPTTAGAFQTAYQGGANDAFVTKLNAAGSALVYSTYLGGGGSDDGDGIAADAAGSAYVTGWTDSQAPSPFPTTPGAFQTAFGGNRDAFITKFRLADPPAVTTEDATAITENSARLNGTLTSLGTAAAVDVSFQYGTRPGAYPGQTPAQTMAATGPFSFNLTDLAPGTWYYFRAEAVGDLGLTSYGAEKSFTTRTPPPGRRVSPSVSTPSGVLKPANMSSQYLSVSPQQTYANQPVAIAINVVNTGDEAGNYNLALKINGQVEQTKMVSVGPQATQPVKFTVTKGQPGTYSVSLDGKQGSFTILGPGAGTAGSPASGGLIAIIIVGILVIAIVLILMLTRRRPA